MAPFVFLHLPIKRAHSIDGKGPAVTRSHTSLTFIRVNRSVIPNCRAEGASDAQCIDAEGAFSPGDIAMLASIRSSRGGCPVHRCCGVGFGQEPARTSMPLRSLRRACLQE
jgi:hypothetical protein